MAQRKTVTPQTVTGEQGITLIARRCLEMGFLFHPRRVDHGIDGHIDLVDPGSRALLNQTLLVQSKASDRPFQSEDDESFRYVCDPRDLDLWLAGNAPVILVFSHPQQDEAWWVDVKSAFPEAIIQASRAVVISKQAQRFDRGAAPDLLRLAVPARAGLYLQPPPITEVLTTNLLPIAETPPVIHLAPAAVSSYREAAELLSQQPGRAPGWILRDGLVLSFADLREPPLQVLRGGDVEEHDTAEWAGSDSTDTRHRFMDLLARTVERSYPDLRWHNSRRHVHFRATSDLTLRKAGKGQGSRGRTVFGPHYAKSDPGRVSYYHHAALRTRYRRIGETWYCQLEPDYCFTIDGHHEAPFADSLLAGIKRLDRHPAVAGWTRMWANHLGRQPDLFSSAPPVIFGSLKTVTVSRGIDDRWWGPAPTADSTDEAPEPDADSTFSLPLLAGEDIDTEDLFTLITQSGSSADPEPANRSAKTGGNRQRRRGPRSSGGKRKDSDGS